MSLFLPTDYFKAVASLKISCASNPRHSLMPATCLFGIYVLILFHWWKPFLIWKWCQACPVRCQRNTQGLPLHIINLPNSMFLRHQVNWCCQVWFYRWFGLMWDNIDCAIRALHYCKIDIKMWSRGGDGMSVHSFQVRKSGKRSQIVVQMLLSVFLWSQAVKQLILFPLSYLKITFLTLIDDIIRELC